MGADWHGAAPLLANAIAFLVAAQVNFLLSQAFTWADRPTDAALGESVGRRWARFHLAIAGTAVLNMLVFAVARLVAPSLVASAAGIGAAALANFLLADRVVFRPGGRDWAMGRPALSLPHLAARWHWLALAAIGRLAPIWLLAIMGGTLLLVPPIGEFPIDDD